MKSDDDSVLFDCCLFEVPLKAAVTLPMVFLKIFFGGAAALALVDVLLLVRFRFVDDDDDVAVDVVGFFDASF